MIPRDPDDDDDDDDLLDRPWEDGDDSPDVPRGEQDEMRALLDRLASEQRRDLHDATDDAFARVPGADLVERTLAAVWADESRVAPAPGATVPQALVPSPREPRRDARSRWLALATCVLVALGVWRAWPTVTRTDPIWLGRDELKLVQPSGAFAEYGELVWVHPAPDGLQFEVRVYDGTTPAGELVRPPSPRLDTQHWLDPSGTQAWPDAVRVEITAFDRAGGVVDAAEFELQRTR